MKNGETSDSTRLLHPEEKESSYNNKTKKKGLFSVFGGKKKSNSEYIPPTAPPTPEALNVTVMENEYDPSKPYKLAETKTDISGLTDRDGATSPTITPRKVGFDVNSGDLHPPIEEDDEEEEKKEALNSIKEDGTTVASWTVAETKTAVTMNTTDTERQCGDSLMNQTLGFLDDICNGPPEKQRSPDRSKSSDQRFFPVVPSDDEEEESTYYQQSNSLQSTIDDSSNDRTYSIHTGITTSNNRSVEIGSENRAPSQDHENFEVVLDTAMLGNAPKRRGLFPFSKREDAEEEKKEEKEPAPLSPAPPVEEPKSPPGRKSIVKRLFSSRKIKEEPAEEEKKEKRVERSPVVKELKPKPKPVPLPVMPKPVKEVIRADSPVFSEELPFDACSLEEQSIERVVADHDVVRNAVPSKKAKDSPQKDESNEDNEKWNKMLTQLELAEQTQRDKEEMAGIPTESFEVKPKTPPPKPRRKNPREKNPRGLSFKGLAKKFSLKSARKQSDKKVERVEAKPVEQAQPPTPPVKPVQTAVAKKPKPLWKAVVDPNSGKTYYYHRKTRETTWKKPDELKKYEEEQHTGRSVSVPTPVSFDAVIEERNEPEVIHQNEEPASTTPEVDKVDEVIVSDDRFKTPPRKTATGVFSTTEIVESPIVPPVVVKADLSLPSQQSLLDQVDSEDRAVATPNKFDATWEKKREIERLLTGLSPPDKASVDKLMKQYEGKEDILLRQLREKVESQPFDEPFLDEPPTPTPSPSMAGSPSKSFTRTGTFVSKASATTKSSAKTEKTEKITNTYRGKKTVEPISENQSTATSLSSRHEDDGYGSSSPDRGQGADDYVPVPRERELMIEELSNSRVVAETFEANGRVTRGRGIDYSDKEDGTCSYYGDNEVDTCTSDTVSALSENDGDFLSRKENFDHARRRALDDAIEREDWDLAAVLSEGMHTSIPNGGVSKLPTKWSPSELDQLIANNDWDAVKIYISRMQSKKKASLKAIEEDPTDSRSTDSRTYGSTTTGSVVKAPSRPGDLDETSLTKRVGSMSQLQHRELASESSWTSDSSYDSTDSDYS